jgi:hypothetical protein
MTFPWAGFTTRGNIRKSILQFFLQGPARSWNLNEKKLKVRIRGLD